MKIKIKCVSVPVIILAVTACCGGCVSTGVVEVKHARTGIPIGGASVISVNGNSQSVPNYTDAKGFAAVPPLPVPVKNLIVKKEGYNAVYVSISSGAR